MYKLLLCLRYLRSRIIAYFAMLAVALCVAMMLIVVSVMNGFLDKIEQAAKGLFGDIVIESESLDGFGRYDELMAEVGQKVPEVESSSPFILTYGILRVPGTSARRLVQVAGVRLPDQAYVTDFAEGLHFQREVENPSWDPPIPFLLARLAETQLQDDAILARIQKAYEKHPTNDLMDQRMRVSDAVEYWQPRATIILENARAYQASLAETARQLAAAEQQNSEEAADEIDLLEEKLDTLIEDSGIMPPSHRIILGLGIPGLSYRTPQGETVRYMAPGHKVDLLLAPMGRRFSGTDVAPARGVFTVIDDCRTDVSTIDSEMVYVPFETLQKLNNMGAESLEGKMVWPARTSQIHVKVKAGYGEDASLKMISEKINTLLTDFGRRYPDMASTPVSSMTWRQRQARIIAPIQQQRTLVVTMFGIISMVSVVLIFVIFYTIVVQKTRDIGVIKAIGASNFGVAQIFLGYGAMIGLVGSILGVIGGYYFVRYINPIQDALDAWLGFRVWSREWFLFEKIPSEVEWSAVLYIMLGAILAGVLGALIPAWRAARMQPVEALRYE